MAEWKASSRRTEIACCPLASQLERQSRGKASNVAHSCLFCSRSLRVEQSCTTRRRPIQLSSVQFSSLSLSFSQRRNRSSERTLSLSLSLSSALILTWKQATGPKVSEQANFLKKKQQQVAARSLSLCTKPKPRQHSSSLSRPAPSFAALSERRPNRAAGSRPRLLADVSQQSLSPRAPSQERAHFQDHACSPAHSPAALRQVQQWSLSCGGLAAAAALGEHFARGLQVAGENNRASI